MSWLHGTPVPRPGPTVSSVKFRNTLLMKLYTVDTLWVQLVWQRPRRGTSQQESKGVHLNSTVGLQFQFKAKYSGATVAQQAHWQLVPPVGTVVSACRCSI